MKTFKILLKRNIKLFFKDKGMFFTSLITPLILLVLYATFLGNVYKNSFMDSLPAGFTVDDSIINGLVGGQLISSILAVSCITVAFCSNMRMVQDRANGSIKDLMIAPLNPSTLSLSYYFATLFSTLIICVTAGIACLCYVGIVGWYLSVSDVLLLLLDIFLLTMFGTAFSSVVNFFLSTQGQISAVGSIISSCYGFICGAYMPISQFSESLQKIVSFLPGTYGTSLVRNHALNGVCEEMTSVGFPSEVIEGIRNSVDCNLYFFDNKVSVGMMYLVLSLTVIALVAVYVLMNVIKGKRSK